MKNKVVVFDNGGETCDRYTIVLPDGECFGCSDYPFHAQGFAQYCGNVCELWHGAIKARELCWNTRTHAWKKICVQNAMQPLFNAWRQEKGDKQVNVDSLPKDVQQYIKQLIQEERQNQLNLEEDTSPALR